ncbi:hypothetical protein P3X46_016378 [Hevea brasiliensis]|uniref:Myb-like domain-containing protein n=1 Tax=Hevea brasiliensis TaxID=3981 RepID=A0ABQ9M138_HEVBR|nr:uncharacterized protein LOC110659355 [Hevea brasiliensis]KAJ9173217.1 hypothetical protein P3X46_016378 [Hevea brasiliensis]
MIHKRPFVDDDSYEVACKHRRHLEHIDQLAPMAFLDDSHPKTTTSDDDNILSNCQHIGRSANDSVVAVSNDINNFESGASGCFPHFLWINNGILEADNLSFFPEYFDHGHQLRALLQPDEVFSSFDYPFWKPVSIGPEHQAFVPEWEGPNASSNQLDKSNPQVVLAQSSSPSILVHDGYEERLTGVCVIPMPDLEASVTHCCEGTKTDCSCLDQGSIECVKQHIMEARQKLRENLGEEIFDGLGFYDMGEDVGKKWTEEEEQLFHDVVLSNPASLGKNFWDHLPAVFPGQTKRELVSYYFNVFMLRRRSEQNRFDLLNIDSDNDEWQRSEAGMTEGDEDSAVESLSGKDASAYYQEDHAEDCNEHIEDEDEDEIGASKESADDDVRRVATDEEYEGDIDDISEAYVGISNNACGGDGGFELFKGIPSNEGDDFDIENDSCTSYECQRENVESSGPLHFVTDGRHSGQE